MDVFLLPSVSAMAARDMVPITEPLFVTIRGSTPSASILSSASVTGADFAMVIDLDITSLTNIS